MASPQFKRKLADSSMTGVSANRASWKVGRARSRGRLRALRVAFGNVPSEASPLRCMSSASRRLVFTSPMTSPLVLLTVSILLCQWGPCAPLAIPRDSGSLSKEPFPGSLYFDCNAVFRNRVVVVVGYQQQVLPTCLLRDITTNAIVS